MVMQKRLDYGFNGYQVPPTPRAARSARRRSLFKRKTDDNQMCAFDLLATVAGKLLLDGESCPPSANTSTGKDQPATWGDSIAKELKDENKPSNEMPCGQVCYERNFLITELVSKAPNPNVSSNEIVCTQNDAISIPASVITTSDCSEKVGSAKQLVDDDCKLSLSIFPTVDADSSGFKPSLSFGLEDENRKQVKMDSGNTRNVEAGNKASLYSSWHVEAWDKKPDALVSSGDSLKFPLRKDHTPCGSVPANRDNVKIGKIDDDENSDCTEAYTSSKAFTSPQHVGDRRIRKFLDSKNCKATPIVKDGEQFNADAERSNLNNSKRQRSPRDYPFKKRKLYGCSSGSNSDEGIGSNESCREPENGTGESGLDLCPALPGATSSPTSAAGGHASLNTRNAQVKLNIKSFRVPELFIEIPETATVGSMKRAVMEAVGSLLGSGLHVGVLLQGKRIRDDNKTLLQTGISHEDKMDSLGFTLEPSSNTTTPIRSNSSDKMLCESPQPLRRYPPTLSITENACHLGNLYTRPEFTRTSLNNLIERDHDSAPSHPGMSSSQKTPSESKALVLVPPRKQDSLAVIPLRKSKRSECAQRRIRRPFTVAEVEALVQAVEKLGTGRWRDVKLRAFDNAKHRTYVDLKDKWKTLVHTARISPQQRRGEPVPQELLDRVLTAHAYWSQQQAKQQLKSHPGTCLLL